MFDEKVKGVRFLVDKEQFGNYIKEKRMALGITQEELAEKLYISSTAISKWENGKTYPDITIISQICNILKISEHEFVSACDDTEMRKMEYEARKYRRNRKITIWTLNLLFAIPLIICFICNLVIDHTVSWFFIVTASLGIVYSIIVLPFYIKKEKSLAILGGCSISIFFIILFSKFFGDTDFPLMKGLEAFVASIAWIWCIWGISRFSRYRLSFNFIFIGAYFYIDQYLVAFVTGEKGYVNPPYIDIYIGSGLIIVGIILFILQKKEILKISKRFR